MDLFGFWAAQNTNKSKDNGTQYHDMLSLALHPTQVARKLLSISTERMTIDGVIQHEIFFRTR